MTTTKASKKYIRGSAKEVTFDGSSSIINLDLNVEDLQTLPVSPSGYIKITVAKRRETDQYGNTHSVYENTFKADKSKAKSKEGAELKPMPKTARPAEDSDDLPF